MTSELVSIASPQLRAQINPFGAELWRLQDALGRDLLWDGDPAFWTGRAPLLFPVIGRLADDRFVHAGPTFELPKHGFARRRVFELVRREPALVAFRLAPDAETRAAYPFEVVLEAEFEIRGAELSMTARLHNAGPAEAPATFGFHPAFRWPLPDAGARGAHSIDFAEPESGPLRRLDATGLLGAAPLPPPLDGRRLDLRDELFESDALVFEAPVSRSVRYGGSQGPALTVSWSGLPHLGIWTKPGAPFVCIEPWASLPAEAGSPRALAERADFVQLAPGASWAASMSVRLD